MTPHSPIYLDYAATTPVDPQVAQKMAECLTLEGNFANPSSRTYRYGWMAEEAVDVARSQVADLLNCDPREIVFTSGATESDNLALKGVALRYAGKGKHIITLNTEHKAVLDTCAYLEEQGFEITYLAVDNDGLISPDKVAEAIRHDTILVSVMHVNNEIGVIQDIEAIGQLCHEKEVLFHVDAAQSLGKLPIDLSSLAVDLMSFSGHKIYGPKGIGALYVRRRPKVELVAQIHGGGHERGMRSGTLATHQIVGMGEACEIAGQKMKEESKRLLDLREQLVEGLLHIGGVILNGHPEKRIYNNLNVSFADIEGEMLTRALGNDIAVSSGSACNSANLAPSYVLTAIGRSESLALSGIRFTVGRFTTQSDIDYTIKRVSEVVAKLHHSHD